MFWPINSSQDNVKMYTLAVHPRYEIHLEARFIPLRRHSIEGERVEESSN